MKKRIMALLMAMVMVLGMGIVSHAEENEVKYYEGTAYYDIRYDYDAEYSTSVSDEVKISAIEEGGRVSGAFQTSNGVSFVWWAEIVDGVMSGYGMVLIDNVYETNSYGYFAYQDEEGKIFLGTKNGYHLEDYSFVYYLTINLEPVDAPTEPTIHEISTPFTGTVVSDRDEYTLALAGYFEKELADGTHVLTPEEINAQTISIVAYNKENGVKRVMTQSTIEEMSVTVANGVVTEYTIRGRVQTSGGKLDRYTAVINN